jgi:hypothetical protein
MPLRIILLPLFFQALAGRAQPALDTLNALLGGSTTFRIDQHDRLVMDHIDDGRRIAQYLAPLADLDPAAVRSDTLSAQLVFGCTGASGRCIAKEQFRTASTISSGRTALPTTLSAAQLQRVQRTLVVLIEERRSLTCMPASKP